MKIDRSVKRQLIEHVVAMKVRFPGASRMELRDRILEQLERDENLRARAAQEALPELIHSVIGEYTRRTRRSMKQAAKEGQVEDAIISGIPAFEAIRHVELTFPIGAEFEDKPAIYCNTAELQAARQYYGEQSSAMAQKEEWCAVLIEAMHEAEFGSDQIVAQLYRVA